MWSLKEKGWKPVPNGAFKIYNIYRCLYGSVGGNSCHPAIQCLTFFKKDKKEIISFNFQHSPLIFAIFANCASLHRVSWKQRPPKTSKTPKLENKDLPFFLHMILVVSVFWLIWMRTLKLSYVRSCLIYYYCSYSLSWAIALLFPH